ESVRSRNGAVIIGFKPDDAPPSRSTGIAKGMTAEQVVQARERLQAVGVQITMTYSSFPAVAGIVSPERVADLRRQPLVDYVVVNGASIALAGAMPASLRAAHSGETGYFFTDTIDWGLTKIGAPLMWTFTGGNGATITMIDSGVDSTHLFSG